MRRMLRHHAAAIAIAVAALGLACVFAVVVLQHTPQFGLPLDDAYIYLSYARQFGRAEPFTYFHGGGYSAGSTSALWPMLLAPFWTLGARGHALVWVSFALCAALYAATCIACYRLVRAIAGAIAGLVAAGLVLAIAPFAWTALAGMEVAFASLLLVSTLILLARAPREGPPPRLLAACLVATSLSRPEAMMVVMVVVGVAVASRLGQKDLRAAAWWAAPLVAPALWMVANQVLAGDLMPNTGVAKSHFYLPGFDATYWWTVVKTQSIEAAKQLAWHSASPLVWPRIVSVLWIAGAVVVARWAVRERRWLAGVLIILSPIGLVLSVIASSGSWSFHNYRYIAPAFPLVIITAACAFAPLAPPREPDAPGRRPAVRAIAALGGLGAGAFVAAFWWAALPAMRSDIALYAQNATDLNRQVVTLGRYIRAKLPDASIMFHDAGGIAYYGDTRVYDMLGLVTNHQAEIANHGPGARFEFLESLPPERRPTHFAYYPAWMGQGEFYGDVLLATPLAPGFSRRRLIGDHDMQLITAVWDHVHTAERPLEPAAGWHIADRIDVADIAGERAHAWAGELGRRNFGDPTARWSMFHREVRSSGLALDGGRTIRGGAERFAITVDPTRPVRLVMRTGGKPSYPWHDALTKAVRVVVTTPAGSAEAALAPPAGLLVEIAFDFPAPGQRAVPVRVTASGPYRVFHWFALQPD